MTYSLKEIEKYSIIGWMVNNAIKNEKGDLIDFVDHPYLYDIYRDPAGNLVCMKAAQVGLSTAEIIKNHYDARSKKMDIIYTLPTDADVSLFVGGKVNRIIANNPCMLADVKDKDSIEVKAVGMSIIYFRGSWTKKSAIMVTADRLCHDEKDSSKADVIADYQARLQHSKFKQTHVFSHPSVKGFGVDVEWNQSDMKEWFVQCPHCDAWQYLSWNITIPGRMSVDLDLKEFVCKKCHGILDKEVRRNGHWRKKKGKENAKFSGYHVSLLMAVWISAADICEKWNDVVTGKQTEDYFYNKVLGLPYSGAGNTVSEETIRNLITTEKNDYGGRIVIGVDTGIKLRYVVGNKLGLMGFGEMTDYMPDDANGLELNQTLEYFLKKFENSVMVIDQGGDIIGSRKLKAKYPGRVFLCHYRKDRKAMQLITWGEGDEFGNVMVDRNRMMQLVIDEATEVRWKLYNGTWNDWYDYYLHWSHIFRVSEEDKVTQQPIYVWRRADRDDWCFASGTMIETEKGSFPIEKIAIGDMVHTRKGLRKVIRSGLVKKDADVVNLILSNGNNLIVTPDHKIWIKGKGWTRVDTTVYGDILETWQTHKQLNSKESNIVDTPIQQEEHSGCIIIREEIIEKKESARFIKKYGEMLLVKFQKDMSYITKTKILSTIKLKILKVLNLVLIDQNIQKTGSLYQKMQKNKNNIFLKLENYHTSGEKLTKVKNGTRNMLLNLLFWKKQKNSLVLSVEKNQKPKVEMEENFVEKNVRIVGMQEIGEKRPVYNLEVEDQHEYFANGILVSNCHATVYWRIGIDRFGVGGGVDLPGGELKPNSYFVHPDNTVDFDPGTMFNIKGPGEDPEEDWRNI